MEATAKKDRDPHSRSGKGVAESIQKVGVQTRFSGSSGRHLISHGIPSAVGREHPDDGFKEPDGSPHQKGARSAEHAASCRRRVHTDSDPTRVGLPLRPQQRSEKHVEAHGAGRSRQRRGVAGEDHPEPFAKEIHHHRPR